MFIFTAKFNRKRAIAIIIALAIILCAIILVEGYIDRGKKTKPAAKAVTATGIKTNADRVNYLKSFGWEVNETPVDEQEIVIPREFTGVYADYLKLQETQGFDLKNYGGVEAKRYTYEVLNYPTGEKGIVADIIVYRNTVIAGDVQSTALNGFMHGLNENAVEPAPAP
ncbi:MAG TPA: DUF4830 domain-containing protein [Clostridiales bacterium]|nr:DUF4830 domain-containing protein [Clostridiales bacterium]